MPCRRFRALAVVEARGVMDGIIVWERNAAGAGTIGKGNFFAIEALQLSRWIRRRGRAVRAFVMNLRRVFGRESSHGCTRFRHPPQYPRNSAGFHAFPVD
jgi:hypothetical protein